MELAFSGEFCGVGIPDVGNSLRVGVVGIEDGVDLANEFTTGRHECLRIGTSATSITGEGIENDEPRRRERTSFCEWHSHGLERPVD